MAEKYGKKHEKMPRSQRAKQFAPFQAVQGLDEALRRAEEEHLRALEPEHDEVYEEWHGAGAENT